MMDVQYSPGHPQGGAAHLLSPTHAHGHPLHGFTSIKQLRRSLSRSPSKPSRFSLYITKSPGGSPTSPQSPTAFHRAFSANAATDAAVKQKLSVRRTAPIRTASRRTSPNSPLRRALSDNPNHGNASPAISRQSSGERAQDQENIHLQHEDAKMHDEPRFQLDDEPIKLDFSKVRPEKSMGIALKESVTLAKSSPLKRCDGVMNLDKANFGSPRAKRRSLHGASVGSDFNIFDHGLDGTQSDSTDSERENGQSYTSSWPLLQVNSAQKRPFSLRKSTLQQRAGPSRTRMFADSAHDSSSTPAPSRARARMSLDSALPMRGLDPDSPFQRSHAHEPAVLFLPPTQRQYQSAPKPHPLSNALTPSSSTSSVGSERSHRTGATNSTHGQLPSSKVTRPPIVFSRSLPMDTRRPADSAESSQGSSQDSFATPEGYKMAKPLPAAFMSTGLISKRNRNVDMPPLSPFRSSMHMPDTPSKKNPHPHIAATPVVGSGLGKITRPMHEFGSPTTPFNAQSHRVSPESFGKSANIFGTRPGAPNLVRRGSFISINGDDLDHSPSGNIDSHSSNDELPPTPTKISSTTTRPQSKGNSLRSALLGRRTSLGPDTFASPAVPASDGCGQPEGDIAAGSSPHPNDIAEQKSPHTPQDSMTPPDPSGLSICAEHQAPVMFGSSTVNFPPATPTGPRDSYGFHTSLAGFNASSGFFQNDVDTTLTARFGQVTSYGTGEFSHVYRVERPLPCALAVSQHRPNPVSNVWAVKKSKKPYTGNRDRARKMREVRILEALRGNEHVIELVDTWESKNHLYIQTEFCENGNLKDFLTQTGFKGRLDDFRIWKILLELSQGVKSIHDAGFIHLDLKPANVFIDWEGVLKIGDFGMASGWPAPHDLDGEGDREYIGPEVLAGRFDKPADIFSLGMILLEIAGNIVLPDNGASWQRLRAGDMTDLPSLTWSSDSSLVSDMSDHPVEGMMNAVSHESVHTSFQGDDDLSFLRPSRPKLERSHDLVKPPNFMVDPYDPQALDNICRWMISPDPDGRPDIDQLLAAGGVQWVEKRRRAGATVFEGNWGPADDVLNHEQDTEMLDI